MRRGLAVVVFVLTFWLVAPALAQPTATPSPAPTMQCPVNPTSPELAGPLREGAVQLLGTGNPFDPLLRGAAQDVPAFPLHFFWPL